MRETSEFTSRKYTLMYAGKEVLMFNKNLDMITVVDKEYLPFGLRNGCSTIDLYRWLVRRAAPLTRDNVEFLYMMCGVARTELGQIETVMNYGATSINDSFWIRKPGMDATWEEVIESKGRENKDLGLLMLTGIKKYAVKPHEFSPEVTLHGNWSKCLVKREDYWVLLKEDDRTDEQEVAAFAKMLGIPVVKYWHEEYEGVQCSACKVMSTKEEQWISAREFGVEKAKKMFNAQYNEMKTFDFIVGNVDRHSLNWSVVVDSKLNPMGLAPLYDFNLTLYSDLVEAPEIMDERVVEEALNVIKKDKVLPNRMFYLKRIEELLSFQG